MTTTKKIRVSIETRTALKAIGRKGESYDAVIRRLMKIHTRGVDPIEWAEKWNLQDIEEEVERDGAE